MKITDITGIIRDGMWSYGEPFPDFHLAPLPEVEWVKDKVWCEIFEGLNSQCGSYLETPAHFFGPEKSYLLESVPVERLCDIPCSVINLQYCETPGSRRRITAAELKDAVGEREIPPGSAILVGSGWGKNWFESNYLTESPYFSKEAIEFLIAKKPFLLGSDLPRWENLEQPEGFFPEFYSADILMLAPLVRLEELDPNSSHTLTALPLNVSGSCCAPCRALVKSETQSFSQ